MTSEATEFQNTDQDVLNKQLIKMLFFGHDLDNKIDYPKFAAFAKVVHNNVLQREFQALQEREVYDKLKEESHEQKEEIDIVQDVGQTEKLKNSCLFSGDSVEEFELQGVGPSTLFGYNIGLYIHVLMYWDVHNNCLVFNPRICGENYEKMFTHFAIFHNYQRFWVIFQAKGGFQRHIFRNG